MVGRAEQRVEGLEAGLVLQVACLEILAVDAEIADLAVQRPVRRQVVGDAGHHLVGEIEAPVEVRRAAPAVDVQVRSAEPGAKIRLERAVRAHAVEGIDGIGHDRVRLRRALRRDVLVVGVGVAERILEFDRDVRRHLIAGGGAEDIAGVIVEAGRQGVAGGLLLQPEVVILRDGPAAEALHVEVAQILRTRRACARQRCGGCGNGDNLCSIHSRYPFRA